MKFLRVVPVAKARAA